MENSNKFLGEVKVGKLLRMFAVPCVISLLVQAFYNIVDQIFIGFTTGLGEFGNTATGIVYPLTVIALAIALCLGDGVSAKISINQGQRNNQNNGKTIASSLFFGFIISALMLVVGLCLTPQILSAFGANDVILPFALDYSRLIIIGFPFFILGTIINPIIRADGSPRYAMFSMISGAITNIILDPLFLFVFKMGMQGAALATLLGQIVTFALSVIYLSRAKTFKLKLVDFIPNFSIFGGVIKLGISSFLTQISIVIISIINNNLIGHLLPNDNSAIGMLTIAFKVFGIVISAVIGVACGGQPIIGYNYGARRFDRVKQTLKYIMVTSLIVGTCATVAFVCLPQQIFLIFGYTQVSDFGVKCFRVYMSMILLTCFTKVSAIFFQSIEKPVKATLVTMSRDLIFLVPLTLCLYHFGVDAFLWSAPISDLLTTLMTVVFLIIVLKKLTCLTESNPETLRDNQPIVSKPGLIITISREHGAGGKEIAFKLAQMLNIPCYDKELSAMVAEESGLAFDYVDKIEYQSPQTKYNLYLTKTPSNLAQQAQRVVLESIAQKGSCVIVGRCADYLLKDYHPYRVFIYANMSYKQQRIAHNYHDELDSAYDNIIKSDKKRAEFYRDITGQEWGDKHNYDLCIDSSIGVENTVKAIFATLKN